VQGSLEAAAGRARRDATMREGVTDSSHPPVVARAEPSEGSLQGPLVGQKEGCCGGQSRGRWLDREKAGAGQSRGRSLDRKRGCCGAASRPLHGIQEDRVFASLCRVSVGNDSAMTSLCRVSVESLSSLCRNSVESQEQNDGLSRFLQALLPLAV
jgi:hypothetical protein